MAPRKDLRGSAQPRDDADESQGSTMIAEELKALPGGSRVAVVTMLGSLCPVTKGHVQMFAEARRLLLEGLRPELGLPAYAACVGYVSVNGDGYVAQKLKAKGDRPISKQERLALIGMATVDLPWLEACQDSSLAVRELRALWPRLAVDEYVMNGADDVVKYRKWQYAAADGAGGCRYITMGRPGSMEQLREGMRRSGVSESARFVLGPVLPDVSSTDARAASKRGDRAALLELLHPAVADWLLRHDGAPVSQLQGDTSEEVFRLLNSV